MNLFTIDKEYSFELNIKKSRFIGYLFSIKNQNDAIEKIKDIRKKHYDATHNCYAYIIGDNQEIQKCSDDGEPQKTAGAPMMDALKKNDVTNILAITTRYFGGIMLGAGGLVRAYSSSVSEALKKAIFYEVKMQTKFQLTITYSGYNQLLKVIPYINIEDTAFTSDVIIIASCDVCKYQQLEQDLYKYKISSTQLAKIGDFPIEILADI